MLHARLCLSVLARFLGLGCVAAAALLLSAHATAQERGFELGWQGPTECSERARALTGVERLLGAAPEQVAAPPVSALATVTTSATGEWQLTLVIARAGASRARELSGRSCGELADAVALILALTIDPEVFSRKAEADGESTTTAKDASAQGATEAPGTPASPAPTPPVPPSTTRTLAARGVEPPPHPQDERSWGFIALGASAALGVLPSPAFGVSLTGGLSASALRLSVTASYFPQRRATSAEQPALSAILDLRALSVWGCWMHRLSRTLRGGACGMTELGAIRAHGEGATRVYSETKVWGATGPGGLLLLELRRDFDLGLEAAAMLPWGRPTFLVAGARVHESSAAVGSVRALLEARF